jgi:hypothetical protein
VPASELTAPCPPKRFPAPGEFLKDSACSGAVARLNSVSYPALGTRLSQFCNTRNFGNGGFFIGQDFPGNDYGFVTVFDALHDMGDPIGAASHVKQSLQADGTFMIVEPFAGDSLAENISPVGRVYYGFSTMICTPGSLSQEVGLALGAQAGERRLRDVLSKGGFTRVRRAAETPFNMILEARA